MIKWLKLINSIRFSIIHYFKKKLQAVVWRLENEHNSTQLNSYLHDLDVVKVGNYTYGDINILCFGNNEERLMIGNFVSIANDVKFILGGNHQINTFTTFPLKSKFVKLAPDLDALTKGEIIIEDEAWIGTGVIVLSGLRIGKGAIIAAGSVVTKDVEPFSIVGGNPAKFIKYRFSENLIKLREDVDINDISKEKFIDNINLFYEDLSTDILSKINNIEKS